MIDVIRIIEFIKSNIEKITGCNDNPNKALNKFEIINTDTENDRDIRDKNKKSILLNNEKIINEDIDIQKSIPNDIEFNI